MVIEYDVVWFELEEWDIRCDLCHEAISQPMPIVATPDENYHVSCFLANLNEIHDDVLCTTNKLRRKHA